LGRLFLAAEKREEEEEEDEEGGPSNDNVPRFPAGPPAEWRSALLLGSCRQLSAVLASVWGQQRRLFGDAWRKENYLVFHWRGRNDDIKNNVNYERPLLARVWRKLETITSQFQWCASTATDKHKPQGSFLATEQAERGLLLWGGRTLGAAEMSTEAQRWRAASVGASLLTIPSCWATR